IDHYWMTESGWPMVGNMAGIELLPMKPGSATKPVVGFGLAVVDDEGKPVPANTVGNLVAKPPLPPGNIVTIWGDDEGYHHDFWQRIHGMFLTGDVAVVDNDGYITLLGRTDEVLNVAAHRLSMREIEAVIESHPAVVEACVIGVADVIKGEEPLALIVLEPGKKPSSRIRVEIKGLVRESIGAIAVPRNIRFVHMLPKTKSGCYMKKVLRAVYEKQDQSVINIAEDGASAKEVQEAIQQTQEMLETKTS
ncbi:MAG: propionyl-CoA synthetase, partial [Promethearchaeota archaeon]